MLRAVWLALGGVSGRLMKLSVQRVAVQRVAVKLVAVKQMAVLQITAGDIFKEAFSRWQV